MKGLLKRISLWRAMRRNPPTNVTLCVASSNLIKSPEEALLTLRGVLASPVQLAGRTFWFTVFPLRPEMHSIRKKALVPFIGSMSIDPARSEAEVVGDFDLHADFLSDLNQRLSKLRDKGSVEPLNITLDVTVADLLVPWHPVILLVLGISYSAELSDNYSQEALN